MKTSEVFFKDSNFVGREIENVQDLVKAVAAGMDIANADGCGYCVIGEREVVDENGTHYEQYERTKEEIFDQMKTDMDDKVTLYAGFFLDVRKYQINPIADTTLQSNLFVGQPVYILENSKIVQTTVAAINLFRARKALKSTDVKYRFQLINTFTHINLGTYEDVKGSFVVLRGKFRVDENGKERFFEDYDYLRPVDEVFATKEELIKHLMED